MMRHPLSAKINISSAGHECEAGGGIWKFSDVWNLTKGQVLLFLLLSCDNFIYPKRIHLFYFCFMTMHVVVNLWQHKLIGPKKLLEKKKIITWMLSNSSKPIKTSFHFLDEWICHEIKKNMSILSIIVLWLKKELLSFWAVGAFSALSGHRDRFRFYERTSSKRQFKGDKLRLIDFKMEWKGLWWRAITL